MIEPQERFQRRARKVTAVVAGVFLLMAAARCKRTGPAESDQAPATLRVGVGQIEIAPFLQLLSVEGLAKVTEEGRVDTRLAKTWTVNDGGLSIVVELRPGLRFHDGSAVTAEIVADTLRRTLPRFMGVAYEDVASIEALSPDKVEFTLRQPSSFVLESLEAPISKPGEPNVGTGPFASINEGNPAEMRANRDYYLGRPSIDRIVVNKYPSVRTAWAEMLRDHLDMVYELGVDARNSLELASSVNVFTYVRHYQYIILLNPQVPALRSPVVRRALNAAIDRTALVRDAVSGHGLASSGPIWPKHWAAQGDLPGFLFDPQSAAAAVTGAPGRSIKFKCLVAADDERVALVVKRQLESVGIEMTVEEGSIEHNREALAKHEFDAILIAVISGPSLFRPYLWWHSQGSLNRGMFASRSVDAALDAIRHATSDDDYRGAVTKFQRAILEDPPAIFLAWDERARAVSKRFEVPGAEPGVDILGTLRLWRPVAGAARPTSN